MRDTRKLRIFCGVAAACWTIPQAAYCVLHFDPWLAPGLFSNSAAPLLFVAYAMLAVLAPLVLLACGQSLAKARGGWHWLAGWVLLLAGPAGARPRAGVHAGTGRVRKLVTWPACQSCVDPVALSPDGNYALVGGAAAQLRDLSYSGVAKAWSDPVGYPIESVALSPAGPVAFGDTDGGPHVDVTFPAAVYLRHY